MANVYSLVCWGGRAGLSATMTAASPCVVTINNHGIRQYNGGTTPMTKGIIFTTTGALYTGLTAGTTYWARYVSVNTFHLYDTEAHALDTGSTTGRINTSGSQSGTHTAHSAYFEGLSTSEKSRYGSAGSERAYAGIVAWQTARAAAGVEAFDTEIAELGEAFTEYRSSQWEMTLDCVGQIITSRLNGNLSTAYHYGASDCGYVFQSAANYEAAIFFNTTNRRSVDGICVSLTQAYSYGFDIQALLVTVSNCVIYPVGTPSDQVGIQLASSGTIVFNCIIRNMSLNGFRAIEYAGILNLVYNNLVVKCGVGFYRGYAEVAGFYYNNIAIGNTTNWQSLLSSINEAFNNAGASGQAWDTESGSTRITIATSDFTDYTNNDFSPASSSSPQVGTGFNVYEGVEKDIMNVTRPAWYESGTWQQHDNWSVGPIEYDFGTPPVASDITISASYGGETVSLSGAEVRIYEYAGAGDEIGDELDGTESNSGSTFVYSGDADTEIVIQIMLSGYQEFVQRYVLPDSDAAFEAVLQPELFS